MSANDVYEYIQGESFNIERVMQDAVTTSDPTFFKDLNLVKLAGYSIELWSAETGGVMLSQGLDYTLQYKDASAQGPDKEEVFAGYSLLTPTYYGSPLFLTASIVGGYTTRPYRPSYVVATENITATLASMDDSIIADASGGAFVVTLPDGEKDNQRFSIICTGGNNVEITGAGILDATFSDIGITYVWAGSGWLQLGGAGSAGAGGGGMPIGTVAWYPGIISAPFGTLICDDSLYEIAKYQSLFNYLGTRWGGDGITTFGVPNLQGIHPGAIGTQDINGNTKGFPDAVIGDLIEDQTQHITGSTNNIIALGAINVDGAFESVTQASSAIGGSNTANMISLDFDSSLVARTGEFTDVSQAMGQWVIQAFDAIQEVPADPGLIKDWVEVYGPTHGDLPASEITNQWGEGLYYAGISYTYNGIEERSNGILAVLMDGIHREVLFDFDQAQQDSTIKFIHDEQGIFTIGETGPDFSNEAITAIYRWGDVATGELNPPVDGWETVFDDPANTGPVPNTTGVGFYQIYITGFSGANDYNVTVLVDNLNVTTWSSSVSTGSSSTAFVLIKHDATPQFIIDDAAPWISGEITKIRKFNSLVNVVHSYQPDPRSVAQKDWIEVFRDDTLTADSAQNVWGTGKYIVTINGADGTDSTKFTQLLNVEDINEDATGQTFSAASDIFIKYTASTGLFHATVGTFKVQVVEKWQDSQANDAPRNVLDDGWEQIYEDESNTDPVPNDWGQGYYRFQLEHDTPGTRYTSVMFVDELDDLIYGPSLAGGSTDTRIVYYGDAGKTFDNKTTALNIKRIWKFTGLLRISASYNLTSLSDGPNQVKALNTDAGNVDAEMPASPNMGDLFEVWNTGTNGYHVNGLPDGITLGDGKGLRLRYVDGWKYEDVIIDEYTDASITNEENHVTKWSGGRMVISSFIGKGVQEQSVTYPEPFISLPIVNVNLLSGSANSIGINSLSVNGHNTIGYDSTTGSVTVNRHNIVEGRWK